MQSSSNLFPVALISAERRGDLSEDVYRLKPGNSPDGTVELAVTRLGLADDPENRGMPVILLHGSFSNRRFWYSPKGMGSGAILARRASMYGFRKCAAMACPSAIMTTPRTESPTTRAMICRLSARLCESKSAQVPTGSGTPWAAQPWQRHWVVKHLGAPAVASVALFGCQVSRTHWPLKLPPVEWTGRLF